MNESPHDAWFYTREGERCGPVGLAELRVKAREGELNPRLDMVWTQGMAEWKPSGEVEGLFEKRAAAEAPAELAPKADPYAPPKTDSVAEVMGMEGDWPGARRSTYLIMTVVFPFVWSFGFAFATAFLSRQLGPEIMGFVSLGANLVPFILGIYFGLARLVNLGMSRWWYLGCFVPFLNLWVGYRCFACPPGYAMHKKMDGKGKFLAVVYWLLIVLALLAVIGMFWVIFGAAKDPVLQEKLQEFLRTISQRAAKP